MAYKLNDEQETLKGGISYYTYIWRTEPGACSRCEELDGTQYSSTDEIPDKVHPNCKCYIDVVENNKDNIDKEDIEENDDNNKNNNSNHNDNSDENKKECYDLTNESIGNCDSLIDEVQAAINELNTIVSNETFENIKDKIEERIENLKDFLNELIDISYSLKDLYFDIQEIEVQEIKRQLDNINDKINSIKNTSHEIYNNAKSEIEDFINHSKNELRKAATDKLSDYIKKHPEIKKGVPNIIPSIISSLFIGEFYSNDFHNILEKAYGENTAGMLDLAHPKINNLNYVKDSDKLGNYNDKKVSKYEKYLKTKIEKQYKDYKNINPKNVDGRYFKSNSKPSIELSKTKEIKEFIKQHKYEIINNILFNNKEYQSIEFPAGDWYYAVHYADIIDAYFDENGNLHVIMTDTYDFNKGESKLIEAGREAMKRGALEPRFLIWDILIPKADLDKI